MVTVGLGEVVSVELPAGSGYSGWRLRPGTFPRQARPGVTVTPDGTVRVDEQAFFAGTKTSIILTVRKDD